MNRRNLLKSRSILLSLSIGKILSSQTVISTSFNISDVQSLPENWDSPKLKISFNDFKLTTKNINVGEEIDIIIKSGIGEEIDIVESYSREITKSNEQINIDIPSVDLTRSNQVNISEEDISQGDEININIQVELKYNNISTKEIESIKLHIIGSKSYIYTGNDSTEWDVYSERGGFVNFEDNHVNIVADAEGSIYSDDVESSTQKIISKNEIDFTDYNKLYAQYEFTASRRDDDVGNDETGKFEMELMNNSNRDTNSVQIGELHEHDDKNNKDTAKRTGEFQIDISDIISDKIIIHSRAHSSNSGYTDGDIYEIWME